MSSLFGRLKNSNASGDSPTKKTEHQLPPTPLEQLLVDAGPLRDDGSDKFFGMHNPSNTCYCNSVLQCLYFSEPFREQVINFPKPKARTTNVRLSLNGTSTRVTTAPSPAQTAKPASESFFGFKKQVPTPTSPVISAIAPSENKDTFDTMKKAAFTIGPHLRMEQGNSEAYGMPESLFTGLKDIFEAVIGHSSRIGIVTPAKLLETLRRNYEIFRSPMHQDAHEFLNILLNEVVDQVEKFTKSTEASTKQTQQTLNGMRPITDNTTSNSNSSWVHGLFEGTLTSETRCLTCENVSQRDEVFLDLSVDLEEHSSVTSCLRKFSAEEMLCERNKFHCDQCSGLQEAEKRMKIKRLPRILALHLKRFKYIEEAGRLQKLFHRVVYPFHLRLFNTTDDAEDPDRLYELYGVVVHLGSTPFHGHYVSIIKTKDKGWLLFDDELVLPVDKDYVRNFFGGDPRNPACAYVLFYKQTTVEAVEKEQEAENSVIRVVEPVSNGVGLRLDVNVPPIPSLISPDVLLTPTGEELEGFPGLGHAATAPSASPDLRLSSTFETPVESSTSASDLSLDDRSTIHVNGRPPGPNKVASFNRFRPTSMSLRQKPKFLNFKSSSELRDVKDEGESSPIFPNGPPQDLPTEKPERNKRFTLGRKKQNIPPDT